MFFHPKNLKSENNNSWYKPWFNILLHTQLIVCAAVGTPCLKYLGYITLICWLMLWILTKGLEYDPYFDDSSQCWHGRGYKDCNMDIHIVPHGCKWWHFYPSQTFKEHVEKFNQLTGNSYDLQITDIFSQKT